jgi:hypothetical protein
MGVKEVADAFTAMLKAGDHDGAAAAFNADDIVSFEPLEGEMAEVRGKAAVKAKSDFWMGAHEVHAMSADGPAVNGDQFAVGFFMDVTNKESGERIQSEEIGIYTVKDGKIVSERFFY